LTFKFISSFAKAPLNIIAKSASESTFAIHLSIFLFLNFDSLSTNCGAPQHMWEPRAMHSQHPVGLLVREQGASACGIGLQGVLLKGASAPSSDPL
jgi:hypothetical protein